MGFEMGLLNPYKKFNEILINIFNFSFMKMSDKSSLIQVKAYSLSSIWYQAITWSNADLLLTESLHL